MSHKALGIDIRQARRSFFTYDRENIQIVSGADLRKLLGNVDTVDIVGDEI